jgi:hypothetical protein
VGKVHPLTLLLVLLVAVPLVVGGAGLVSFLLLRSGYGYVVGGILPFLVSLLIVGVIGVVLGRAASGRRDAQGSGQGRNGEADDV